MTFDFRDLHHYKNLPDQLMIGLSGGRSSAYQAAHIIAAVDGKIPDDWIFVFENTGLELEPTYKFLWNFTHYFGIKLHMLEFNPFVKSKVSEVDHFSLARNGEPMDLLLNTPLLRRDGTIGVRPLPNPAQRTCTATLKVKTAHRFARQHVGWSTKYHAAIGYRADEPKRVEKRKKREARKPFDEGGNCAVPMFEAGVVKDRVESFFRAGPFDLELDSDFGNCDFCFMASTWKIKQRMVHICLQDQVKFDFDAIDFPPARVARWIAWEERQSDRPGTFRKDRPTMRELWVQVCLGNFESAVPEGKDDVCGICHD